MSADTTVIGLGYVGLTLAVAMAEAGMTVVGVEQDANRRAALAAGRVDIHEPGLAEAIVRHLASARLTIAATPPQCRAHIVCVGTQSADQDGMAQLTQAVTGVAAALAAGDLVILRSTMPVGGTRKIVAPLLAERDVHLAYCPERTAEGAAVAELAHLPQIVGGLTTTATEAAGTLFERMGVDVLTVSTPEAAEISKLSANALRDLVFAFANETAKLAEAAGADVAEIVRVTNEGYPRAGLARPGPVGGPCLTKDPTLLVDSATALGSHAHLANLARSINAQIPAHALQTIIAEWGDRPAPRRILLAGLAFKGRPETSDTRGSPTGALLQICRVHWPDAEYVGADPWVSDADARRAFDIPAQWPLHRAAHGADIVVLNTNHAGFSALDPVELAANMGPGGLIYDFWAQLQIGETQLPGGVRYRAFGAA